MYPLAAANEALIEKTTSALSGMFCKYSVAEDKLSKPDSPKALPVLMSTKVAVD